MNTLQWLNANLPFLQTEQFNFLYGLIVFLNPLALSPQLIKSYSSKKEELVGVSVLMFAVFFVIQLTVALGAISKTDFFILVNAYR